MSKEFTLDITKIPFGTADSRCMIICEEQGELLEAENGLYLSQITEGMLGGGAQFFRNKDYLLITPVADGKQLSYTYGATNSAVRLITDKGKLDITFAPDGGMRWFAEGISIRLTAKMGFGDVAAKHGNDAEADMDGAVYYMIPVRGSVSVDSHYNLLTYRYTDPVIEFTPEDGKLEIAIFDHRCSTEDTVPEENLDECRKWMNETFYEFTRKLVDVPAGYETMQYGLWIAKMPFQNQPEGVYPSNVITAVYPRAVEQPILSLAFSDQEKAFDLIDKFTKYATRTGLIPEKATRGKRLYQTVSMEYGYAALKLLEKAELCEEKKARLYNLLITVDEWWTKKRSDDDGTSFFYAYRFEAGNVKSGLFIKGTPASAPDLQTRMILSAKAIAKLAGQLGFKEAEHQWNNILQKRLSYLIEELWQGDSFTAKAGGEKVSGNSILCYEPLLLGELLPADIAKKLGDNLMNGPLAVEGRGIKPEAGEDKVDMVTTALLAAGLAECGLKDYACRISGWLKDTEEKYGLSVTVPVEGKGEFRCGGLYQPVACAAEIFCASQII